MAKRYGVVACVSGRRASEARAMVSIGSISYIGSHGAELLRAGWTESVLDPTVEEWAAPDRRVRPRGRHRRICAAAACGSRTRAPIVAFHWRGAPDEDAARAAVDALAAEAEAAGLRTHWGRKVLEVRPPVRIDKGAGIATLLEGAEVDGALYVGDDVDRPGRVPRACASWSSRGG